MTAALTGVRRLLLQWERRGRAEKAQGLSVNGLNNSVGCHGAKATENHDHSVLFYQYFLSKKKMLGLPNADVFTVPAVPTLSIHFCKVTTM